MKTINHINSLYCNLGAVVADGAMFAVLQLSVVKSPAAVFVVNTLAPPPKKC